MKTFSKSRMAIFTLFVALAIFSNSCKNGEQKTETEEQPQVTEQAKAEIYQGDISALNSSANNNMNVSGMVRLELEGDQLKIKVEASGLEPDMMHLQHLHGAKDASEADCPEPEADKNSDGVIDVTEAAASAGITMIPFHGNPLNLTIKTDTYPKADSGGNLSYTQTVNLDSLNTKFKNEYGWEKLDFSKFTYMIHGVKKGAVPQSAGSVMDVPAHVTLPVGCAKLASGGEM